MDYNRIKDLIIIDRDPEAEIELIQSLGRGSYGYVFKGRDIITGQIKAVKVIPIESENELNICLKELEILSACKDPNIVSYYCSYMKENYIWIVLEFCDGGSLKDLLHLHKKDLTEE